MKWNFFGLEINSKRKFDSSGSVITGLRCIRKGREFIVSNLNLEKSFPFRVIPGNQYSGLRL